MKQKIKIILLIVFFTLFFKSDIAFAEQINLPKDSNGWTIFTPSSDSRIMYVTADGNDSTATVYTNSNHPDWSNPQNPSGTINTFATYAAAYANARDGYPDWILFKRGDTFTQTIGDRIHNGRSVTEPFLVGAYGSSGASPILKTGTGRAFYWMGNKAWVSVSGIAFYAHTRDPDGVDYAGTNGEGAVWFLAQTIGEKIQGILIEGCSFRFYNGGIAILGNGDVIDGVTLYRNRVLDAYTPSGGNCQGMFAYRVNNLILKESIFDHNGWYSKAGSGDIGEASMFGHNSYIHECIGVLMEGNIFTRAASSSNKFRSDTDHGEQNIIVNNNLNVGGETGYAFNGEGGFATQFVNVSVTGNVLANLGYPQPTNRTLAWGFELNGIETANLSGNYIIDQTDVALDNSYGILTNNLLTNATINNNVFYNFRWAHGLLIQDPAPVSTISNVTFSGNKIQIPTDAGYTINSDYNTAGKWTFSGNQYYSSRGTGNRYRLNGSDVTLATWQSATGDDSIFEQVEFPDPSRNITSYMTSIGEISTLDAFFAAIRNQDRYNWDSRLNAGQINNYIKAGFGGDTTAPSSPTGLGVI